MNSISENAESIKKEVAKAATDAGRDPSEIQILAAAKYTDREGVAELLRAGINLIGENRVKDATVKHAADESSGQSDIHDEFPDCRLHMIGHLQTNKINHALRLFDLIETVDRVSLADGLEKRLAQGDRILPVLVEVKLTGEETKTGCPIDELSEFLDHLWSNCPHLAVRGLMGMGPWDPDPEVARPYYRELKELFDTHHPNAPDINEFNTISMGMSADFMVAIQEGATLVRIGRSFFNEKLTCDL